jgi:hypothetical protein
MCVGHMSHVRLAHTQLVAHANTHMRRNLLKLGVGGMMVGSVMIPCSELVSIRVPHHMSACKRQRSPSQQRLPADKRGCALGVPGAGPPHPEELIHSSIGGLWLRQRACAARISCSAPARIRTIRGGLGRRGWPSSYSWRRSAMRKERGLLLWQRRRKVSCSVAGLAWLHLD